MPNINWGIIGCGDVTEIKSGPAFNKVPHSRLVAVMRRNRDKAKDYAQRHGVPKWYGDAMELINDPEVNAIYVATPPSSHEEYAISALKAGKPVYLEKPMSVNSDAASRIESMSEKTGTKISIAHYRRQQPVFLFILSLIREGVIGEPRLVNLQFFQPDQSNLVARTETNWRLDPAVSGGGLFHDLAPHQIDLMIYFFGRPKKAGGASLNTGGLYAADDTVSGHIIFESGVVFNGAWCFSLPEKRDSCEVIGTKGKISFSIFEQRPVVITKDGKEEVRHFDPLPHVQQPMIGKVVEYFLGLSPNPCSASEGVEVMQLIDALLD
jgi:predicted dehydrogenase